MHPKLKPCNAHGGPSHVQSGATWDPMATASHKVGPNRHRRWGKKRISDGPATSPILKPYGLHLGPKLHPNAAQLRCLGAKLARSWTARAAPRAFLFLARPGQFKYTIPNMMLSPMSFKIKIIMNVIIAIITTISSSFSSSNPSATFEASFRSICRSLCRAWLCTPFFSRRPQPALTRCWRTRCHRQSARGLMRWRAPYKRPQERWGRDCRPGRKTWADGWIFQFAWVVYL